MLTLVEGRHATGENAFRVMQMTFESDPSPKLDDEIDNSEPKCDSPSITRDNSFKFDIDEEPGTFEKPFSDWVCPHFIFPYVISNNILYRVLAPLRHLKNSPQAAIMVSGLPHLTNTPQPRRRSVFRDRLQFQMLQVRFVMWHHHSTVTM